MSQDSDPIYQTIVESITEAFEVMLMTDVSFLDVEKFDGAYSNNRIIATIGLAGNGLEGNLNLLFTPSSAGFVVSLMLGEEAEDTQMLEDGVGELANLVAGGVKKRLAEEELDFNISLPSVLSADNAQLSTKSATALYPFQFVVESEHMVEGVFLIREVQSNDMAKNLEMTTGE